MTLQRCGLVLTIAGGLFVTGWSLHATAAGGSEDKPAAAKDDKKVDKKDEKSETVPKKEKEKEKEKGKDDGDVEKKLTPKKIAMKLFMRKKLEASQSLLEGLAVEDFDLIATGARQLKTTSAAAEFMVVRDPMYAQHAEEFRRIVDKLEKAAKEKRLDGATLAYVDMTMSCVECHKYVRNILIADK